MFGMIIVMSEVGEACVALRDTGRLSHVLKFLESCGLKLCNASDASASALIKARRASFEDH